MTRDRKIVENQGVPEYATYTDLPSPVNFSGIAFVQDTNLLYQCNGTEWVNGTTVSSTAIRNATIDGHALVRSVTIDTATRMHMEPNGYPVGVRTKLDFLVSPYDANLGGDSTNYLLGNVLTKTYDPTDAATNNFPAVMQVTAKGQGQYWGAWPAIQFGFNDSALVSPLKLVYFDTADTVWHTPMLGAWRTGMAVTIGDFVTYNNKIYQASTGGTTGATGPSHGAGTVSDGAVDWLWIRTPNSGNVKPVAVIGDTADMPKFGFSGVRIQYAKDALMQNGIGLLFEDQTGVQSWKIYNPTTASSSDLRIEAGASAYMRFNKASSFVSQVGLGRVLALSTDSSGIATPSVVGVEKLNLTPAGALSVTSFAGRVSNQVFL